MRFSKLRYAFLHQLQIQLHDGKKTCLFVLDGVKRKYPHIAWSSIKPVLRCFDTNLLSCRTFHLPVSWHILHSGRCTLPYTACKAAGCHIHNQRIGSLGWNEFQATNAYVAHLGAQWRPMTITVHASSYAGLLQANGCFQTALLPIFCYLDGLKHMILVTTLQIWPIPSDFAWWFSL